MVNDRSNHQARSLRLIDYLPDIYKKEEYQFLRGFLSGIDDFMNPLVHYMDFFYMYFDPGFAPEKDFLPWLAQWFDLALDEHWPMERRRQLVKHAAELYEQRGTARGLRNYLAICLGFQLESEDARSKIQINEKTGKPFYFEVTICVPNLDKESQTRLERIIEEVKPAHTAYKLIILE